MKNNASANNNHANQPNHSKHKGGSNNANQMPTPQGSTMHCANGVCSMKRDK
jgi:hypothetical protein